jgi:hypothetical protein
MIIISATAGTALLGLTAAVLTISVGMEVSDANERFLVIMAQDDTIRPIIRGWPKHVNDGHKLSWRDEARRAGFLKDFKKYMEHKQVQRNAKRAHMRHGLESGRIQTRCIILASWLAKPC